MRRQRVWGAVTAAVVVSVLLAGTAPALAASGEARVAQVDRDSARIVFTGKGLVSDAARPPQVVVTLDGERVPSRISGVSGQGPTQSRSAVLLVDTSGSMLGAGIAGAKQAAFAFLDALPSDVRVGLTTFSAGVQEVVPPTHDRGALRAAVAGLSADGGTSLNDGVVAAARTLGTSGMRRILLLSDGADSASATGLAGAVAAVEASGVQVSAVQFGADTSARAALTQLAAAGKGTVLAAGDGDALARVFTAAAQDFTTELTIDVTLPASVAGRVLPLEVQVVAGADRVVTEQRLEVPADLSSTAGAARTAAPLDEPWFGSDASLPWAAGALFVGLLLLLATAVGTGDSRATNVRRTHTVLERYTLFRRGDEVKRAAGALGDSSLARSAVELAGRVTEVKGVGQRLAGKLDRAAVPFLPAEWVVIQAAGAALATALMIVLLGSVAVGVLLGLALGVGGGEVVLAFRIRRRRAAFLNALPESLQLVAGGLSSGYSLLQALDAVVREGSEPIAGEIGRALAEARLGVDVGDALDAVGERMQCEDFSWVVMAIRVQREVGGNLAGVLQTVAATLRDRAKLRRQVKALSAEGRLSAWVLIGLPILLGLYLFFFNNSYFRPMYTTFPGIVMLGATAVSMTIGAVWMNKMVKVEV